MRRIIRPPGLRAAALFVVAAISVSLAGCQQSEAPKLEEKPVVETTDLVLSSTTSTQDSGLFEDLIPAFEKANPESRVKVIAVGSGEAMKLGERKDADVLLVHSPAAEKAFVEAGFGKDRRSVMYNDFVIVGPTDDPAKIEGDALATDSFRKIAGTGSIFVSRGDDSGTHNKEKSIWASATVDPAGKPWYLSVGQGMGEALKVAMEKRGYTIADRATWLTLEPTLADLALLVEGDEKLFNPYSVIEVTGAENEEGAKAFADWITSEEGQKVIGEFGVAKYGQQVFVPDAGK